MAAIWQGPLLHLFTVSISSLEDRRQSVLAGFIEEPNLRGAAGTQLQERHHPCITAGAFQVLAPSRYKHHVEGQLSGLPHPTCIATQTQSAGPGAVTQHCRVCRQGCHLLLPPGSCTCQWSRSPKKGNQSSSTSISPP